MASTCNTDDTSQATAKLLARLNRLSVVTKAEYDTPCHLWQGTKTRDGYGIMTVAGRRDCAHRVAYRLRHGQIPEGKCLDHLCRRPSCVNPEHLEPVTQAENCRRGLRAKLTAHDVAAIRGSGDTQRALARRFGVTQGHISRVKNALSWRS